MSTFVFAPSWVTYPNHPKTLKEEKINEFPILITHNKLKNTSNKKENNNVWSNPSLIQKIHHSGDEDEEEADIEEKKYELERLKALVPKTKKSLSASSKTIPERSVRHNPLKLLNKQSPILKESPLVIPTIANITNTTNSTTNTTTTIKSPDIAPTFYISEQEQQHFIYFIQSWTSTGIISSNIAITNHHHKEYSYFNNHISSNSSHGSSSSDDISFQSDTTLYTSNSYFHHDPF